MRVQNQIYGVTLPVHIAQQARIVAAMNGKSRSSLMRDLLLDYLEKTAPIIPAPIETAQPIPHKRKSNKRAQVSAMLPAM